MNALLGAVFICAVVGTLLGMFEGLEIPATRRRRSK